MVEIDSVKLPDGWQLVRLDDVAEIIGGSTPSRASEEYWGGSIPWVVPSELTELSGRYLSSTKDHITNLGMKAAGLKLLPPKSILLTSRATVGVTAMNTIPVCTNQGFQSLVVRDGVDSIWLFYYISAIRRELIKRAAGSTFDEISRDSVRSLPILLPSVPEQYSIGAVLESINETIERTEAVIDAAERLRDALLHELLTCGVAGQHTGWRDGLDIGTASGDWQSVYLRDIAQLRTGVAKGYKDDSVPYIALEHIRPNGIGMLNGCGEVGDSVSPKTAFCRGDILYGKLRPNLRKIVRVDTDGVCSTDILAIYGNDLVDGMFLSCLLRSDALYRHAMKGITGTRMPRTSWNHLQTFKLLLPPLRQQRSIASLLDSIDKVISQTEIVLDSYQQLLSSASDSLLNGRIITTTQ